MTNRLFTPLKAGAFTLPNRIIMSPLTRCRAVGRIPNDLMVEYYRQRASAGMILSEATSVDPMGVGYPDTPGIWSQEQINAWKKVTQAVHDQGGIILLQLWHVGRISDPTYLDGNLPVAPSAIAPSGHVSLLRPKKPYVTPRALAIEEIPAIIESYRLGALNAEKAGFDGVEIHGANGYLLDQFLQDSSNHRTDDYGGSVVNRARLMLQVTDAVISVWGAERTGMHIAPHADSNGMGDSDPVATFGYVATELGRRKIAFIFARESYSNELKPPFGPQLKKQFGGVYIANESFTQESAEKAIEDGYADAVAWGQLFIANPDLPERFKKHSVINAPSFKTYFTSGAAGYTDYSPMK